MPLKRHLHIIDQPLRVGLLLMHILVIHRDLLRIIGTDRITGQKRTVKSPVHIQHAVDVRIYAHTKTYPRIVKHSRDPVDHLVKDLLRLYRVRHIEKKGVGTGTAGHAVLLSRNGTQLVRHPLKNLISKVASVHFVDQMEAVHIQNDRVHTDVRIALVMQKRVLHEELSGKKPCQRIALRRGTNVFILGKLDGTAHARPDHLRHIVGLRNKIHSTELKAFYLGILIRS